MKLLSALAVLLLLSSSAQAAFNHKEALKGPFANGPEVTTQCLTCHKEHAEEFMKSSHWTWELEQKLPDRTVMRGKKKQY